MNQEDIVEPIELAGSSYSPTDDEDGGGEGGGAELFVFGYGCKLFRDDEKAGWIDEGKHLIPWMGCSSLLIDRYDARGALTDLAPYESKPTATPTPHDLRVEAYCDEERWRELTRGLDTEASEYQEEEYKKLQMAVNEMDTPGGSAIGYTYEDGKSEISTKNTKKIKEETTAYKKPSSFHIPPEITLPESLKSHAIIEKTALFIAGQGVQMEIILKTKQSRNPSFNFLNFNDPLNPYYKFVVEEIRQGRYTPWGATEEAEEAVGDGSDSNEDEDGAGSSPDTYLHPSLFGSQPPPKPIPSIQYKSTTSHSAYSELVSRIKEFNQADSPENSNSNSNDGLDKEPRGRVEPNPQESLVIQKMAHYVMKNGPAFQSLVMSKGDPRFGFLEAGHEFHWFYQQCKEEYEGEVGGGEEQDELEVPIVNSNHQKQQEIQLSDIPMTSLTSSHGSLVIPIANLASIQNRKTTVPAELATRLEELKRKALNKASSSQPTSISSCDNPTTKFTLHPTPVRERISFPQISNKVVAQEELEEKLKVGQVLKQESRNGKGREEEDAVARKVREERKRKAAIFLQKLKKGNEEPPEARQEEEGERKSESGSDVESIPCIPQESLSISKETESKKRSPRPRSRSGSPVERNSRGAKKRKRGRERREGSSASSAASSSKSFSSSSTTSGKRVSSRGKSKKSKKKSKRKKSPTRSKKSKKHRR